MRLPGRACWRQPACSLAIACCCSLAVDQAARPTGLEPGLSTSNDAGRLVAPVTVAQKPLVELAGRQPRQLGLEIDRARHLLARQRLAAKLNKLFGEIGSGRDARHR